MDAILKQCKRDCKVFFCISKRFFWKGTTKGCLPVEKPRCAKYDDRDARLVELKNNVDMKKKDLQFLLSSKATFLDLQQFFKEQTGPSVSVSGRGKTFT